MILASWTGVFVNVLSILFAVWGILLIGIILLQRGRGSGLSGAFGGAGGGSSAFGAKTGDVLTVVTVIGATIFLVFAIGLNYLFRGAVEKPEEAKAAAVDEKPAEETAGGATGEATEKPEAEAGDKAEETEATETAAEEMPAEGSTAETPASEEGSEEAPATDEPAEAQPTESSRLDLPGDDIRLADHMIFGVEQA